MSAGDTSFVHWHCVISVLYGPATRFRVMGSELATGANKAGLASIAAEQFWGLGANEYDFGAGAANRTAAGRATRNRMARRTVRAVRRFDCVLCSAAGSHAVQAEPDGGHAATPQSRNGFRSERNRDCRYKWPAYLH